MKILKSAVLPLTILLFQNTANAQMAYDGYGDFKIFVGYANVGGKSGIDIQFDTALGELVSMGGSFNYLIKPKVNSTENDYNDTFIGVSNFFENYNAGLFARFHFGPTFKIAETMDPYLGVDVSLKSLGAHAGFKYKLTDVIGFYAQYNYSFSSSFIGGLGSDYDEVIENYYGKSNAISVGVTFNIEY